MIDRLVGGISRGLHRQESGFTVIETMMAVLILVFSLVAVLYATSSSLGTIAFARQRQAANGIAAKLMEDVRGIAYTTLGKGLNDSDLGGDSSIASCSGVYRYQSCSGETIVHDPTAPTTVPLNPHQGTFGAAQGYPTTYSWALYVTNAANAPSAGAFRVTVRVSWIKAEIRGASNSVQLQTLIYSPAGCTSGSTHPFAAPCQPFFHGVGNVNSGSLETTGTVSGLTFDSTSVDLRSQSAEIQQEQVTHVLSSAHLAGGSEVVGGTTTQAGEQAASSVSADSDPSTAAGTYSTQSVTQPGAATVGASNGNNALTVTTAGGDTGQSISTTTANATNSCNGQVDGLSCSYSTSTVGGGVSEVLALGGGIGSATLVSVGNQGAANTAYGRRVVPVSTRDGNVRETVTRSIPTIAIGGLPDGVAAPANWPGYWIRLSGYSVTTSCEAGTDSAAPTLTIAPGGQISTWNGSNTTTTNVTASGGTLTPASVDVTTNGMRVQISALTAVQFGASPTPTDPLGGGTGTRTTISTNVGSPLVASIGYRVSQGADVVADLTLNIDLATVTTLCTYQPAPAP
ncbi:MAG: hypothetical protein ACJ77A_14495 [Actinomycetota bacterium]